MATQQQQDPCILRDLPSQETLTAAGVSPPAVPQRAHAPEAVLSDIAREAALQPGAGPDIIFEGNPDEDAVIAFEVAGDRTLAQGFAWKILPEFSKGHMKQALQYMYVSALSCYYHVQYYVRKWRQPQGVPPRAQSRPTMRRSQAFLSTSAAATK